MGCPAVGAVCGVGDPLGELLWGGVLACKTAARTGGARFVGCVIESSDARCGCGAEGRFSAGTELTFCAKADAAGNTASESNVARMRGRVPIIILSVRFIALSPSRWPGQLADSSFRRRAGMLPAR